MAVRPFDVGMLLLLLSISAFWVQPSLQDACIVAPYMTDSQNGEVSLGNIEVLACTRLRLPRDVANPSTVITTTTLAKPPPPAVAVNQTGPEVTIPKVTPKNGTTPRIELLIPHNLGENGTGIRLYKECNTTAPSNSSGPTPICVSDPIVPDEGNSTASGDINMEDFSEPQDKLLSDNNSTNVTNDTHEYYNSTFIIDNAVFEPHWTNLMKSGEIKVNELLSHSHRRATTLRLQFEFPFYGQFVRNVTIATGGFIYTGDYIHSWLAATQYIAPLMANFDTNNSEDSYVKYIDNGTALTVIWENVVLQDRPMDGKFTFAATLYDTGDLAFIYKDIPIPIESIQDVEHPVKVGLSDAFIIDHVSLSVLRRKTIYEYHRLEFRNQKHITNNTIVKLTALPSCPQHKTCTTCLQHDTVFECTWCPKAKLCSIGNDRQRQEWMYLQCFDGNITDVALCEDTKVFNTDVGDHASPPYTTTKNASVLNAEHAASIELSKKKAEAEGEGGSAGAIVAGLIAIVAAGGIMAWFLYAYRNPHTNSGQFLVKYRPSQWSWRRGEARYTAATIHM